MSGDSAVKSTHKLECEVAQGVVVCCNASPDSTAKGWAPKSQHVRVELERAFEFGYMTRDAPEVDWDDWYRCEVAAIAQHATKVATSLACARDDDTTVRLVIMLDVPTLKRAMERCSR